MLNKRRIATITNFCFLPIWFYSLSSGRNINKDGKQQANWARATSLRVVPAANDDRQTVLHPSRFFPASLSPVEDWWRQTPNKHDITVSAIQLRHLGIEHMVSPKTIEMCHDRRATLTIKMFCRVNASVQDKPAVTKQVLGQGSVNPGTITDYDWKPVSKSTQIVDGLLTYIGIMSQLFPWDYGPTNILRIVNYWQFFAFRQNDQVKVLKEAVNGMLARNAQLAGENRPPMTFTQLDEWVPRLLRSLGGGTCHLPDAVPVDIFSAKKNASPIISKSVVTKPSAKYSSIAIGSQELCSQFNTSRGCPRNPASTPKSCVQAGGNTLHHRCSHKEASGRICGGDHPKPKHV